MNAGQGFDYWYGFQGGEASQWHTPLFENTAPIEPPHDDPNWHFSEAIAEKAISWISQRDDVRGPGGATRDAREIGDGDAVKEVKHGRGCRRYPIDARTVGSKCPSPACD
jgi:hypothetical protein